MDEATILLIGAYTGLVGGLAGVASLVWTVAWSVTLRPRARWSLNRFDSEPDFVFPAPPPLPDGTILPAHPPVRLDPPLLRFYFRNTGTAAADDAHAIVRGGPWDRNTEFPETGRERIAPGEEIVVKIQASPVPEKGAGRPYPAGDDAVFDLAGVKVKLRWRRQSFGFGSKRFRLNKAQLRVPFR